MGSISIIIGPHRPNSQSLRFGNELAKLVPPSFSCTIVDLFSKKIPLWDQTIWDLKDQWSPQWNEVAKDLEKSEGFIICCPEYGGMVPAILKNFFLLATSSLLGNKPALLVGISSGQGGQYPLQELRSSSYKNTKIVYLPDHLVVRNCEKVSLLKDHPSFEERLSIRAIKTLELFAVYTKAFREIRQNSAVAEFPYS